jgi:hypothetical protein
MPRFRLRFPQLLPGKEAGQIVEGILPGFRSVIEQVALK